jgi:hypothetical protein
MKGLLRLLAPGAACLLMQLGPGQNAWAQAQPRGQSVADREHPNYDPIGARLGTFTFYPYIAGSLLFDDNVFYTSSDRTADLISTVNFGLRTRADGDNYTLRLDTGGDIVRYLETTSQNYWQAHFSLDGRYDIDPGTALFGQLESQRRAQPRDAVDAVNSLTPTIYYDTDAVIGFSRNSGLFNTTVTGAYQRIQYEDSEGANHTTIDNGPLNRNQWSIDGLVGYNYVGTQSAFVRFQGNVRDYPGSPNADGFHENSRGFELTLGGDFDFDGIITGRLELGYQEQDYFEESSVGAVRGPLVNLNVLWNVTPLTSITGTVNYNYEESISNNRGNNNQGDSPGYRRTYVSLGIAHELRRNVLLFGRLDYANRQFINSSETDNIGAATIGARYLIDNGLVFDSWYQFRTQRGGGGGGDYVVNQVFVQLRKTF